MKYVKAFSADIAVADNERAVTARISTSAVDRDGEVLIPGGCDASEFEKNPIVFLNHDYWSLPIGKCVSFKRTTSEIVTKTVFASRPTDHPAGTEWLPSTLFDLFKQGVLRGFSVGFTPVVTRMPTELDRKTYGDGVKRVFSSWRLLEYSVAALPANAEAIALAVSKNWISQKTAVAIFGELPPLPQPTVKRVYVIPCGDSFEDAVKREISKAQGRLSYVP